MMTQVSSVHLTFESRPCLTPFLPSTDATGDTQTLATWLSEQGLIQHRVEVEVEYFLELVKMLPQLADFPKDKVDALRAVHLEFSAQDAQWVKDQERITNHDVKAVEYFVKDAMDKLGLGRGRSSSTLD